MTTFPTHNDSTLPYSGEFAWGEAETNFPKATTGIGGLELIVDGEVTNEKVDYVDTCTLQYRILVRDDEGRVTVNKGEIVREMKRAKNTLHLQDSVLARALER